MATLPIYPRHVITPYMLYSEEKASIAQAANNKVYIARAGGYRYRLTLNITPFNILKAPDAVIFEATRMVLTKYPDVEVPIFNTVPNTVIGTPEVLYDAAYNEPGNYQIKLDVTSFTGTFTPGQYIKMGGGKNKIYQVESYSAPLLTLVQRLRQRVNPIAPGDETIITSEPAYGGIIFNGIMGSFINEDFGNSVATIDNGILGTISPLSLVESI